MGPSDTTVATESGFDYISNPLPWHALVVLISKGTVRHNHSYRFHTLSKAIHSADEV
jgi:hypothetical protein